MGLGADVGLGAGSALAAAGSVVLVNTVVVGRSVCVAAAVAVVVGIGPDKEFDRRRLQALSSGDTITEPPTTETYLQNSRLSILVAHTLLLPKLV